MNRAIHVTHEAVQKIGGIGAVINGLCTSDRYKESYESTLLYGPLFDYGESAGSKLGRDGEVFYSGHDNFDMDNYHAIFEKIEERYGVDIVYGKRRLVNEFNSNKSNLVDTVLVGVKNVDGKKLAAFKFILWEKFGIQSDLYPEWDYEQYLRIALPYLDIITGLYGDAAVYHHFAHEYMGVPAGLAVLVGYSGGEAKGNPEQKKHRTIFYAHEISPCRNVVENSPGHDMSFYNLLYSNRKVGKSFEDQYGSQRSNYRAELVKRTREFDYIFAVSDLVKDEYNYFIPDSGAGNSEDEASDRVRVVYNGISIKRISGEEKLGARKLLQEYVENLFNFTPDVIITHVTRLVLSKGIWRDITLLYMLDELFHRYRVKGAYILLSTLVGSGRPPSDVVKMEREYGWPIIHREGWPDLVGYEKEIYDQLSLFNARSKSIKGVFLNQFGFDRRRCGERVPEGASFLDLRMGSDVELGFSIYEPFGIAQLETIPFGGIAALSSSCGSSFLLKKSFGRASIKHYCIADFTGEAGKQKDEVANITTEERFELEKKVLKKTAEELFNMIPKADADRLKLLSSAAELAENLGWEKIVEDIRLSEL